MLHALHEAGDVDMVGSPPDIPRWQMSERWADASPWHGTSRQHTLHTAGFALPPQMSKGYQTLRAAMTLISAPQRPDGSWNRDREACRALAAEALERCDE